MLKMMIVYLCLLLMILMDNIDGACLDSCFDFISNGYIIIHNDGGFVGLLDEYYYIIMYLFIKIL